MVSVRCSASSSIQPSISTSPVSYCWAMAAISPSASRLSRAAIAGRARIAGADSCLASSCPCLRSLAGQPDRMARRAQRVLDLRRSAASPKWNTLAASTASAPASTAGAKSASLARRRRWRSPARSTAARTAPDQLAGRSRPGCRRRPSSSAGSRPAPSSAARRAQLDRVDAGAAPAAVGGDLEARSAAGSPRRASTDSTSTARRTWSPPRRAARAGRSRRC